MTRSFEKYGFYEFIWDKESFIITGVCAGKREK